MVLTTAIDEILFANIDVTSSVIAWTLLWIGSDTSIQDALKHEIKQNVAAIQVAERNQDDVNERVFLEYIGSSSTLIHACYLETLRISPPAFFSLPEKIPKNMVIEGWKIPKGQPFVIDAWSLNHRSPIWGNDGDVYNPYRFIQQGKPASRCM